MRRWAGLDFVKTPHACCPRVLSLSPVFRTDLIGPWHSVHKVLVLVLPTSTTTTCCCCCCYLRRYCYYLYLRLTTYSQSLPTTTYLLTIPNRTSRQVVVTRSVAHPTQAGSTAIALQQQSRSMDTPAVSPSPAAPTPPAEQTLDSHMLPAEPSPAVAPRSARPLSAATSSATTTTTTTTATTTTTTTTTPPSSPPPAADAHVHPPDMFSLLGGALATVHPPRRPQRARPASGLRLSFDLLGIGPPHPDRFGSLSFHDTTPDNGALDLTTADEDATLLDSNVPNAMQTLDLVSSMPTKPRLHPGLIQTPYRHDVATLTPPADAEPSWRATTLKHLSDAPGDSRSPDLPDLPAQASSIAAVRNAGERTVTVASEANVRSNSDDGTYIAACSSELRLIGPRVNGLDRWRT